MSPELRWRASSYSDAVGQCVELADTGTERLVRDSKVPGGPVLSHSRDAWTAFLTDLKHAAR